MNILSKKIILPTVFIISGISIATAKSTEIAAKKSAEVVAIERHKDKILAIKTNAHNQREQIHNALKKEFSIETLRQLFVRHPDKRRWLFSYRNIDRELISIIFVEDKMLQEKKNLIGRIAHLGDRAKIAQSFKKVHRLLQGDRLLSHRIEKFITPERIARYNEIAHEGKVARISRNVKL